MTPKVFWTKVEPVAHDGLICLLWTGSLTRYGYGRVHLSSRPTRTTHAHRWAYEQYVGPVPEGMVLDHLCRNRACVNPNHLEPVTNRENLIRGEGLPARNLAKTHCPKGHPLDGVKMGDGRPYRYCRTCVQAQNRASYYRMGHHKRREPLAILEAAPKEDAS